MIVDSDVVYRQRLAHVDSMQDVRKAFEDVGATWPVRLTQSERRSHSPGAKRRLLGSWWRTPGDRVVVTLVSTWEWL